MALFDPYTIKPPILRTLPDSGPTLLVSSSPLRWKMALEALAYFFKREMRYDFPQFEASEDPSQPEHVPYEGWLFHEIAYDQVREIGDRPYRVMGAACFRWREGKVLAQSPSWSLDWVWFHPYERRKGRLRAVWPMFRERYGVAFPLEFPLSSAMRAFVRQEHPQFVAAIRDRYGQKVLRD